MVLWALVPLGVLGLLAAGFSLTVSRAYRTPQTPHEQTPEDLGIAFEPLRFPTAGGLSLAGWWIPAAEDPAGAPTLILIHGWSRNAERMLPFVGPLHRAGFNLLAFDARCHGQSACDGVANMLKFSEDIRAAVSEILRRGADPGRVGVLGHSVGGAGTIHAAANDPRIRAVVTVGAFAHPRDMTVLDLSRRKVPGPLARLIVAYVQHSVGVSLDEIAPENVIARIAVPVLLVHGEQDEVVPVEHALRLASAGGPNVRRLLLPRCGHSDCDGDPAFWPAVLEHLDIALQETANPG
ncbi:MAG: alpha/beta fold hydrolase [Acidobacteria bacterium]|nr:alpha/beta fold hydrolase [Acidobacteriota bacterium]